MSRPVAQVLESYNRASKQALGHDEAVDDLERSWNSGANIPESFWDFIPIRLVTLIEAQARYVIAQAIDSSDQFKDNATKLIDRWSARQVLDALAVIGQGRITIGELAAHSVAVGRYPELIETLEKIFGLGVESELRTTGEVWIEDAGEPVPNIIADYDLTKKFVKKLFHARHILVHETPAKRPYELSDIPSFIAHARQFIQALYWFGLKRTLGPVPRTQLMMTLSAHDEAAEAEAALWALRGMSSDEAAQRKTRPQEIEAAWDQFAQLSAEEAAAEWEGGTGQSMARSAAYASLNGWRVEQLRAAARRKGES